MIQSPHVAIIAKISAGLLAAASFLTQPAQTQREKTKTERLLGESFNKFASDENGWTHLHWSALANDAEAARKLLEAGAMPNPLALGDNSPFSVGGQRKAGLLGHDMEKWTNQKQTPLHEAAYHNATETAALLLENGAEVNAKGRFDQTPLDYAIHHKNTEMRSLLKRHGGRCEAEC